MCQCVNLSYVASLLKTAFFNRVSAAVMLNNTRTQTAFSTAEMLNNTNTCTHTAREQWVRSEAENSDIAINKRFGSSPDKTPEKCSYKNIEL